MRRAGVVGCARISCTLMSEIRVNYRRTGHCVAFRALRPALAWVAAVLACAGGAFAQSPESTGVGTDVTATPSAELAVSRLSPQVRELPIQVPTPTIPIDAIRTFLKGPRLISDEELVRAPYVSALANERLVSGSGDEVYVKDLPASGTVSFSLVRRGEAYRDPDSGEALGYEAVPVAEGEVRSFGVPGTVMLVKAWREARVGDRLIAPEQDVSSENMRPHAPAIPVGGKIIGITDGFARVGQYQIVALNRGSRQGLESGHVLDILHTVQPLPGQPAVAVPETRSGQLLIFKVSPGFSYGLVMSATQPIYKFDRVETPALDRP